LNVVAMPIATRSSSMFQLFGIEPSDGATVTFVVPTTLIVVVFGAAGARLVANAVLSAPAASDVEPTCTLTPV
jgi:hypothetical protein